MKKLRSQLAALQPVLDRRGSRSTALQADIETLLGQDVAWQTMIDRITANLPAGCHAHVVRRARHAAGAARRGGRAAGRRPTASSRAASAETTTTPTTAPPPTADDLRRRSRSGTATDYPTLASWLDAMGKVPRSRTST